MIDRGLVGRLVSIKSVPPHIVALTALASYVAQLMAIVQGWPLWGIVLVTLLPWVPLFTRELIWTYRHYQWLALFYVLVVTQGGHVVEHVAQVLQIHVLGLPPREARGIFGALDIEWVHFVWNSWVLVAVILLLLRFRSNPWLWATLAFAAWHELEHVLIMSTYLTTGVAGTPGLLSRGGQIAGGLPLIRPDLHMLYNAIESTPLVVAFVWQLKRSHDVWLAKALPRASAPVLVAATSKLRAMRFAAGEEICVEGDLADAFFIVTEGEVVVTRQDASGRPVEVRDLGAGEYFGEIGLLVGGLRTATVRAKTSVEVLAMDRRAFRRLLESSSETAEDLREVAERRLAEEMPVQA